jgi:hypothetical protein
MEQIMPNLRILFYNGSLVSVIVVSVFSLYLLCASVSVVVCVVLCAVFCLSVVCYFV